MITYKELPPALRHPAYEQYEVHTSGPATRTYRLGRVWRHTGTRVWHVDLAAGTPVRKGFGSRDDAAAYLREFTPA